MGVLFEHFGRLRSTTITARSLRFTHATRRQVVLCCSSHRESKDPKSFDSMEHARTFLKSQATGPSIPGFIQWLSESPGFTVGRLYKLMVRNLGVGQSQPQTAAHPLQANDEFVVADLERMEVLTLLDREILARVVRKCPSILSMSDGDMALRLILIKSLFPGCNASVLIERSPACYLMSTEASLREMAEMQAFLHESLKGADVVSMVHEDPELLLLDIPHGVEQFKQLWAVDENVLQESDPMELALAIRTLCAAGKGTLPR